MKRAYWLSLEMMLKDQGFALNRWSGSSPSEMWFKRKSTECFGVTTHLKFVFKPKLRVLTVQLGWRHEETQEFCLEALRVDWPLGFAWLTDAKVIDAPCLILFNLSGYMGWSLAGMPIPEQTARYKKEEELFRNVIAKERWEIANADSLWDCYINDYEPFGWRFCNSALRVAQIAGLSRSLRRSNDTFDQCAATYSTLIESDMFSLGSALSWTNALRARITA